MYPLSLQGEWEGPAGAPSLLYLLRMPNTMINFYVKHDSNIMEKKTSLSNQKEKEKSSMIGVSFDV